MTRSLATSCLVVLCCVVGCQRDRAKRTGDHIETPTTVRAVSPPTRAASPTNGHGTPRKKGVGPRARFDSTGARVPTDATGRPVQKRGDYNGTKHPAPVDSFELVTIGTTPVGDIPDEGQPCLQGDYDQPFARLLLHPDSTAIEWKTLRPRCLPLMPTMPRNHYGGVSGNYRMQGDTLIIYWPPNGTGRELLMFRGLVTRDSLVSLGVRLGGVAMDLALASPAARANARRYLHLARQAPPPSRPGRPGLDVVGDTFTLVSIGARALADFGTSPTCDPAEGPKSERLIVFSGGRFRREWTERASCDSVRSPRPARHVARGTYQLRYDTLTFYVGAESVAWLPGVLMSDSLREIGATARLVRRYTRRPHHQAPPKNAVREMARVLLHRLNPHITGADVLQVEPALNVPARRRAALFYGVRTDRVFHGDARDELFVVVETDSTFTRVTRTLAVVPTIKWLDTEFHLTRLTPDSVLINAWSRSLGERVAEPLDRDARWGFADLPGWTPQIADRMGRRMQYAIGRWLPW